MDPTVRAIVARGKGYTASDLFTAIGNLELAKQKAAALWDTFDVLVVPTAPTIYTLDALADEPVALNRNLGTYTNFVNLLDMAAIAVPSAILSNGLPFGITLIGPSGSDLRLAGLAQRFHHASDLPVGATGLPLPAPRPLARPPVLDADAVRVAVVGAHLSGLPLNGQLVDRGARLEKVARTAARYRFYALPGTVPPKPGLVRVADGGAAIDVELWQVPVAAFGSFVALVPAPLGIGTVELDDGSIVQGFLCESVATTGAEDITHHGGWRSYLALRATAP
jgi:allophanate hydrolase